MKTNSRVLRTVIRVALVSLGAFVAFGVMAGDARGDCVPAREPPASATGVTAANRELATNRFVAGNALLEKQDYEGALELFLRSRALWFHWANTLNAAVCLEHLGRHHEALAFYEEVLRHFSNNFSTKDREQIAKTIEQLQKRVLRVQIEDTSGTLVVDTDSCGTLPRAESIYLPPGVHVFRIMHAGNPERSVSIEGHAGAMRTLRLPPLPPPPSAPLPLPASGQWFVQAAGGPAVEGARSYWNSGIASMNGYLLALRGGHRFANQFVLGLDMGRFYAQQTEEDRLTHQPYIFYRTRKTRADFMSLSLGWDPYDDRGFTSLFRIGIGILGAQSISVVDADKDSVRKSIDEMGFAVQGRSITYSVTPMADFEIGLVWHIERIRVGFSFETMFLLAAGSPLAEVSIAKKKDGEPFMLKYDVSPAYLPSFLFVPQIVVEYGL